MSRSRFVRCVFTVTALVLLSLGALGAASSAVPGATGGGRGVGLAIVDFEYVDTSGEPVDQEVKHRQQLSAFMSALRRDFSAEARYGQVSLTCANSCLDLDPEKFIRAAADAGARIVVAGGIHKLSTLVQWAKVQVIDVNARRVILEKLFTFRGDNDEAWSRAESFVFKEIRAGLESEGARRAGATDNSRDGTSPVVLAVAAGTPAPVKLAVFDFELQDTSAGASATGAGPSDIEKLMTATAQVRQLLAQSGRYQLVDAGKAGATAVKEHTLHECDGCDARIALELGADQSFVGVIARISRTEYTIRFRVRDTHTGAVVAEGDSGLRMGADYSWDRGAVRLVKDQLLSPGR